jgi:chromosome segregation ATPase
MHRDHCQLRNEDDLWRLEIAAWQRELETARKDLSKLEAALREHDKALQTHAAAIRAYEADVGEHEHALAAFEQGGSGGELIDMAKAHEAEVAQQNQRRQAHERIKRHHHALMAQWNLLLKAMGSGV